MVEGPAGPIAGARVVLEDGAWERAVETDARGAFRFPEARTGWCTIVASARDHRPESSRVAPGMARRTLRIRLRAELAEFALRVVDGEGRPVEGAEVEARYEGRDGATVHAITDATGFALALSRNPRVRVSVEADGFAPWGITLPWRLDSRLVWPCPF